MGTQRNATNAQIWGKKDDSNYNCNCTASHYLNGTYEISSRWIFVRLINYKIVPVTSFTQHVLYGKMEQLKMNNMTINKGVIKDNEK
jgi:hypothetical protein